MWLPASSLVPSYGKVLCLDANIHLWEKGNKEKDLLGMSLPKMAEGKISYLWICNYCGGSKWKSPKT